MTDFPRFQVARRPFDNAYRHYHGAGLVAFVLSCADRWMAWRERRVRAGGNTQIAQTPRRREVGESTPVDRADGERGVESVAYLKQSNAQSASRRFAMLLSPLPVVLAMAAALPNDAKAWGEVDVPAIKQSRLGHNLLAIDAYNLVRRNSHHLFFIDVRTSAEMERLGVPRFMDANVPFLSYAAPDSWDHQRRDGNEVANADFVRAVGEQLAANALNAESVTVLICADGTRSACAADVLAEAGNSQVYTVIDGFESDQVATDTYSGRRATNGWKLSHLPWSYPADLSAFSIAQSKH